MAKQVAKHKIDKTLHLAKYDNSNLWYARFRIDKKWYTKATEQEEISDAINKGIELRALYQMKFDHNIPIEGKRFDQVANLAIKRMDDELLSGAGKVSYKDYKGALNKYHIPFFKNLHITSIDRYKLLEFNQWRVDKMKRVPAKSTILTHNAAMQRVFDEAVINKWMTPTQIPPLPNKGLDGGRRASFTKIEFNELRKLRKEFINSNNKKAITRDIRELLFDYIDIAAYSGIRPGTEMENLTWGDISMERRADKVVFYITVSKGKTTKHTGARKVVCRPEIALALDNLIERFPARKPSDVLFRLEDGSTTKELSRNFEKLLQLAELKDSAQGARTLYSLRHSYITWMLLDKVPATVIASQCGTSLQMLDQHYNHVMPEMFTTELSGIDLTDPLEKLTLVTSKKETEELAHMTAGFYETYEREIKRRGCI